MQTGVKIDSNIVEYASSGVSWDREIRPEDCRFTLQGLTNDDKRRSRGTDFSIFSSQWIFLHIKYCILFKKRLPEVPEYANREDPDED